ncbi:MAG TPA: choice-of-anchor tandem repeat GloVer-containing protein [Terriglobales bacterium]|nr:choice-of-anchor tandem repeat GloVer-containing protein [Terriglobales bacterium]
MRKPSLFSAAMSVVALAATMASAQTTNFVALHQFNGQVIGGVPDGANPEAALLMDAGGNLFGTTFAGGTGEGVVFKIDSTGKESVLFVFDAPTTGTNPASPLIQDGSGNLIGVADGGPGAGVIFRVAQDGEETTLFNFQGGLDNFAPKEPTGGVFMDKLGNIFGTTLFGGSANCRLGCGTIFRLDPAGALHVVHKLNGLSEGSQPFGPFIQDGAGNMFGVAKSGGNLSCPEFPQAGCGTVFKIAKTGKLTVLHTFQGGADGAVPQAGLLIDAAGNLFGAASAGGNKQNGLIFKISPNGTYTVLHRFNGKEGSTPNGGLVEDEAGNLFGTAVNGGSDAHGTAFELTQTGRVTVLHNFLGGVDGAAPAAGLIRDQLGHLFGTTQRNFIVQRVQGGNVFEIRQP